MSKKPQLLLGLVFLTALVPYLRTLGFAFTYDDHAHVTQNAFLRDGSMWTLLSPRYLELQIPDQARPVLLASHLLDRAFGGGPAVAHLSSALWHALCAVLVLLLARAVGLRWTVAAAAGALFGVHPALAEAVAGVSNREDVLATVFVLAAVLLSLRALKGSRWWWLPATLAYALALGSKEVAIVMPALLAATLLVVPAHRRSGFRQRALLGAAALCAVSALWLAFQLRLGTPGLSRGAGSAPLEQAHSAPTSAAPLAAALPRFMPLAAALSGVPAARKLHADVSNTEALSIEGFRIWQLAVGWPTSSEYDLEPFQSPWALIAGAVSVALLLIFGYWGFRHERVVCFSVAWLSIATLPVLLPTLLLNPVADRFLYLPAVGACVTLAWALLVALPRRLQRPISDVGWPAFLLAFGAYGALGLASIGHWKNDVALFSHAVRWAPQSARAHQNLGAALLADGKDAEARAALLRAVTLDPGLTAAHYNLAIVFERAENENGALTHYRAALEGPSVRGEQALRQRVVSRFGSFLLRSGRYRGSPTTGARRARQRPWVGGRRPNRRAPRESAMSTGLLVGLVAFEAVRVALRLLLIVLVLHFLRSAWASLRRKDPERPPDPDVWPRVTVQIPLRNEFYVVERVVRAACELDYPADRLQIQVLDDSTDETRARAREVVEAAAERGHDIQLVTRPRPTGFKAGALNNALSTATGELLAMFDADCVPARDFLRATIPWFSEDRVACVQVRWSFLNRSRSLLTRVQAIVLDGLFAVDQFARASDGLPLQFNGTNGVWRRKALEEAGGWNPEVLAEDADLSFRAYLAGWRVRHLRNYSVPTEIPEDMGAFRAQQRRWALGSAQMLRTLSARILRAPIPARAKLMMFMHLGRHSIDPLILAACLSTPLTTLYRMPYLIDYGATMNAGLVGLVGLGAGVFYARALGQVKAPRREVLLVPLVIVLAIGLSLVYTVAFLRGLVQRGGAFVRTPKAGDPVTPTWPAPATASPSTLGTRRSGHRRCPRLVRLAFVFPRLLSVRGVLRRGERQLWLGRRRVAAVSSSRSLGRSA